jgi:dTDP-glucose 4,6-dehydratase
MKVLLTGGCGFIGSSLARLLLSVVNLDELTHARNTESLADLEGNSRYRPVRGDTARGELTAEWVRASPPGVRGRQAPDLDHGGGEGR